MEKHSNLNKVVLKRLISLVKVTNLISNKLQNIAQRFSGLPNLSDEFQIFGGRALHKLINDYQFETVLDVGSGEGLHSEILTTAEKNITAIDYGDSVYFKKKRQEMECIVADYNTYQFEKQFDCIWCSHVLEHQLDVHSFLKKIYSDLNEGGILAITVPPLKHVIVGGHVSLWNAGLLLYRLVLAGFDCRGASVLTDKYNISVIVQKKSINVLDKIEYDSGDIRKIRKYLPSQIKFHPNRIDDPFYGQLFQINW